MIVGAHLANHRCNGPWSARSVEGNNTLCKTSCRSRKQLNRANIRSRAIPDEESLATQFSQLVNERGLDAPNSIRQPSHLMPPTAVVSAQMDALQRNDWPEPDSGIRTAFSFCKPHNCESMLPGQLASARARSWSAEEKYLDFKEFCAMVHEGSYSGLVDVDMWQPASPVIFPSSRFPVAVQAIEVLPSNSITKRRFTFCLENINKGPYKGCWLTVGVRIGDYAN